MTGSPALLPGGIIRRQIVANITIGAETVQDWTDVRVENTGDNMFATATIVCTLPHGDYDQPVVIEAGAIPGNGLFKRFDGFRRKQDFSYWPRSVSIECIGKLGKAAEYFNGDDPLAVGGLTLWDLVPGAVNGAPTAVAIRRAVLDRVGVAYTAANIHGTGRFYGAAWPGSWINFVWKAGTPTGEQAVRSGYFMQRAGTSALDYLHAYDIIEAEVESGGATGGFYRIVESLGGEIFVVRVGGRPRGSIDVDVASGLEMIFTEAGSATTGSTQGQNVLDMRYTRDYPRGNRVLVTGGDTGLLGPMFYEAPGGNSRSTPVPSADGASNPYMATTDHFYDKNPPSSEMLEWDTAANATASGFGMDCQTPAEARLLEVNREEVSGHLTTPEDWTIGPFQTHLVQGPAGQPDRVHVGEKLWCTGNTFELHVNDNGAPELTQTPTHLGGGLPDNFNEVPTV